MSSQTVLHCVKIIMHRTSRHWHYAAVGHRKHEVVCMNACERAVGTFHLRKLRHVEMADGVCARTSTIDADHPVGRNNRVRDGVFPAAAVHDGGSGGIADDTFAATIASARGRICHVQFLLVAQKQISAGKAAGAFGAFKGLLLGVGAFVALQMLQTCERAAASGAYMGPRFLGFDRRIAWGSTGSRISCSCRSRRRVVRCRVVRCLG